MWAPIPATEVVGGERSEPFTSQRVLQMARQALSATHQHLVRYLEEEAKNSELSRDAIEVWGKVAEEESGRFDWAGAPTLKALEEAIALYPLDGQGVNTPLKPSTLAWHDHTGVIIPLTGEEERILVEYTPDMSDEHRVERLRYRYAGADHALETVFEWRGYVGRESAVVDGWELMRQSGRGFVASLGGTFGFVVGTVARRLTRPEPTLGRDPMWRRRLIGMSEKYPHIAAGCPDLSTIAPVAHDAAAVFVHGTVSCGIQSLKELYPLPLQPPGNMYRYEHDTFLKLDENGSALAEFIRNRVHAKRLLIAAHSRGGLVAVVAAHQLKAAGYPGELSLCTFGTPYLGTPLVAQGKKTLNLLYKLGEEMVGAIPGMTPLAKGFFYTVDSPILPPGIGVMHEDSDGLPMLRMLGNALTVRAWGSDFNIHTARSGFGVVAEGALLGALQGRAHDLVVPTASALGLGMAQPVLSCSHVQYFLEPAVQTVIAAFLAAPVPAAPPAPPAPGASSPALTIEDHGDYVVIGGIRLEKRRENPEDAAKEQSSAMTMRAIKLRRTKKDPTE